MLRIMSAVNEVRITTQRSQRVYVTYILHAFEGTLPHTPGVVQEFVVIRGMGGAIQACVNIAEIVKKRIPGLFLNTSIVSETVKDMKSKPDGRSVPRERKMAIIFIKLSKVPLDPDDVGYQKPAPALRATETFRVVLVGCDMAGKTTLFRALDGFFEVTGGHTLYLKDLGGIEANWAPYFNDADAMIWVVDGANHSRLAESRAKLYRCLEAHPRMPYVVLLNRPERGVTSWAEAETYPCCVRSGDGVSDAMERLGNILAPPRPEDRRFYNEDGQEVRYDRASGEAVAVFRDAMGDVRRGIVRGRALCRGLY